MIEAGHGVVRALRTALAVLLVLGLATSAHSLGGGEVPGVVALAVLGLLLAPAVWWAGARRLGPGALVALLGGAQVVVHASLVAMAPVGGGSGRVHVHGGLPSGLAGAGGAAATHVHHLGGTMLLAHVVATLVTALLLSRAEAALWAVVVALLPRVVGEVSLPVAARPVHAATPVRLVPVPVAPLGGRAPPLPVS